MIYITYIRLLWCYYTHCTCDINHHTTLTCFLSASVSPAVCCVAVRNCLECRQRQRDRSCKSSLTSSKSQDSLHSASNTSKVPHTHTHTHTNQIHILHTHLESDTETRIYVRHTCFPYLAGSRQTPAGCRHQSSPSCSIQRRGKCVCVCIFIVYAVFYSYRYEGGNA